MNQKEFLCLCADQEATEEYMEKAIAEGASVNRKAKYQGAVVAPLFVATMEFNMEGMRILTSHNAKPFPGFLAAMILEDEVLLRYLVEDCHADINCKDVHNRTPLLCAVISNNAQLVKWLVDLGADVNVKVGEGYNALTYAVFMHDDENKGRFDGKPDAKIIKILIEAGADYKEAMLSAIRNNNLKLVRLLVKNGVDISSERPVNNNLISMAILNLQDYGDEALPLIEFLIKQGADIDGLPVFRSGDMKGEDEDDDDLVLTNNINLAVSMESVKCLELLLRNGADPNLRDSRGRSSLMYAVLTSHEVLETLLKYGADPNTGDYENRTPLILAVIDNDADTGVIETLLKYGANPNLKDNSGFTPLLWAVNDRDRSPEIFMSALIRTGAIRAEGSSDWCAVPVMFKILQRERQLEIVRILIKYGADVTIPDRKGISALGWAAMNFDGEITEILKSNKRKK